MMIGHPTSPQRPNRREQRGASLLEALLAFVVLAGSTLAVSQLQHHVRLDADLSRQRSQALRLGEAELETLRAFTALATAPGGRSYAAVLDADVDLVSGGANTAFRIVRRVDDTAFAGVKSVAVRVQWADREGGAREVALASFIGRADPALAGSLSIAAGTVPAAPRGVLGRSVSVPVDARDLGDGRSGWKPSTAGVIAFVFDNGNGSVMASCTVAASRPTRELASADLTACTAGRALLVSGTIRFTSASPPVAAQASEEPLGAAVSLSTSGATYPTAPLCSSEARKTVQYVAGGSTRIEAVAIDATPASVGAPSWLENGDRYVAWNCVVTPRADGRWSGRADVVATAGWAIGAGSGERRVCRFTADLDGSGSIDANREHPAAYADVATPLPAQNFLVIAGSERCPAAPPVRLTGEGHVVHADLGTAPHQP
ncbi:MAG: hypothetical protein ABIO71_00510 [Caldimonas sp.]